MKQGYLALLLGICLTAGLAACTSDAPAVTPSILPSPAIPSEQVEELLPDSGLIEQNDREEGENLMEQGEDLLEDMTEGAHDMMNDFDEMVEHGTVDADD